VKITNGTPGLTAITLIVNGTTFSNPNLAPDQTVLLDINSAMTAGNHNNIIIETAGEAGGSALVLIADAPLD